MEPTPLGCYFMSKFNKELKVILERKMQIIILEIRAIIYIKHYMLMARYFFLKEIPIGDKVVMLI